MFGSMEEGRDILIKFVFHSRERVSIIKCFKYAISRVKCNNFDFSFYKIIFFEVHAKCTLSFFLIIE